MHRRSLNVSSRLLATGAGVAALLGGSWLVTSPALAVPAAPTCTATATPNPAYVGDTVTITLSGLTPNEPFTNTQTHNGTTYPTSPAGSFPASGPFTFGLSYVAGTWSDEFHGNTSGATCTVSWTVLDAPTTTVPPTTAAPTTAAPTTLAATTTLATQPAQAVNARPTYTG